MPDNGNLTLSRDLQRLVIAGFLKNGYVLSASLSDVTDSYFTDSSCRIIYRALVDYYTNYGSLPTEEELQVNVEKFYVEIGDPLPTVKDNLHELYKADEIDEGFLLDRCTEFIKKVRVRRALQRNTEKIRNGTGIDDETVLNDLIDSLNVSYNRSSLLCLSDVNGIAEARHSAVGDNSNAVIKSILPSVNTSLQYRGYQLGTMNLIVSPPGCFVGETRVMTPDGSHRIDALFQRERRVRMYGCSPTGAIREGQAQYVYLSKRTDDLVDVSLGHRKTIRCTPDHPFMLRDGTYKRADMLNGSDELMTTSRSLTVGSVKKVHLREKVPVYGLVNAMPFHNYAIEVGEDGDGVFVSNTGKTSYLVNEGAYAALQGFNTLHVFLGDMVTYDGFIRYLSNISGEPQDTIVAMSGEEQSALVESVNSKYNGVLSRIGLLSYGSGEVSVEGLIENINQEQDRSGIKYDDIIIDYADNFEKPNVSMYTETGQIYDKLALFGRKNHSVIMVASQPKIQYWNEEIIPLEGASESSKKQHIVDLFMAFNLVQRNANIGTFFISKVRRGISGRLVRVRTEWERCRLQEITEAEYDMEKSQLDDMKLLGSGNGK